MHPAVIIFVPWVLLILISAIAGVREHGLASRAQPWLVGRRPGQLLLTLCEMIVGYIPAYLVAFGAVQAYVPERLPLLDLAFWSGAPVSGLWTPALVPLITAQIAFLAVSAAVDPVPGLCGDRYSTLAVVHLTVLGVADWARGRDASLGGAGAVLGTWFVGWIAAHFLGEALDQLSKRAVLGRPTHSTAYYAEAGALLDPGLVVKPTTIELP